MQSAQIQKDKLKLIEKIIQLDDETILESIKLILKGVDSEYILTEEQKNIVRESTENYLSGKDKGKSWEVVKSKLLSNRNG